MITIKKIVKYDYDKNSNKCIVTTYNNYVTKILSKMKILVFSKIIIILR